MMVSRIHQPESGAALAQLLEGFSAEVTSSDHKSIDAAGGTMRPGSEVFIASGPSDTSARQLQAALQLSRAGLTPVPHIVARNIATLSELDRIVGRLREEAHVNRAMVLAGDRNPPVGKLHNSLQLIESGLFQRHGINQINIAAYPEGHPRISLADLGAARAAKLAAAAGAGLDVRLVRQLCFESAPILTLAQQLSAAGMTVPLRVGVAGLANHASLLKYASICGVGGSIRALKSRPEVARNLLTGGAPDALMMDVALAHATTPALNLAGVHFFPFASLAATVKWAEKQRSGTRD